MNNSKQQTIFRFFVYGTLKSGYVNNRLFKNPHSKKVADHVTDPIYTIYDGGFPIVTRKGTTAIHGEIWETTSQEVADNVNSLEGCTGIQHHPNNWYDFDVIETPVGPANIFVMNHCGRTGAIESGEWGKNRVV